MTPIATQSGVPWPESVQFTSKPTNAGLVLETCGVYQISLKEAAASNGVYTSADVVVSYDAAAMTLPLKPRDTLTWGGRTYTILDVGGSGWLNFGKCTARNLAIAYDLQDLATIRRPTPASSTGGLRTVASQTVLASDVACRLQPEPGWETERSTNDRLTTRRKYTLWLGEAVELAAGDTVIVSGVTYEAVGQSNISRIDSLTSVSVERMV